MQNHQKGFTLIEAVTAMLVTAILIAVAVPAWSSAASAAHNGSARSALAGALRDGAGHAAMTGAEVILCPDTGAGQCSGGIDWSGGWVLFADLNRNRVRDSRDVLLKREPPLRGGVRLRSTPGRTRLAFKAHGGNTGSNLTFTLCDDRGVGEATTLVVANDGRLRQGAPKAAAAEACVHG